MVEKDISHSCRISNVKFWIFVIAIFLTGTIAAAFYPAFLLSSFKPVHTLKASKGSSGLSSGKNSECKSLVVIQFTAAIVLIAGALGFYRQLQFMKERELGININQTLVLPIRQS